MIENLNVLREISRKVESKTSPDVANLIAISDKFWLSLDELIKGNVDVKTENFY